MRKSIRPQSRRHIWIYDEDWDFINHHVSQRAGLAPGSWVREVLHHIVLQVREERHLQSEAALKLWTHATEDKLPPHEEESNTQ